MALDVGAARAFVIAAQEQHFGRAAARLFLTQQALSKRIARLESSLAVRLFDRNNRRVALTADGRRLLPYAERVVDSADAAVASVAPGLRRLRVDVLHEPLYPFHLVRAAVKREPALPVQITARRHWQEAIPALQGGEIDVAFGRAGTVLPPWPREIRRRLVYLEPIYLLVGANHRFAERDSVRLDELRDEALWFPLAGAPQEWIDYLHVFSAHFELDIDSAGATLDFEDFLTGVRAGGRRSTLFGAGMPEPIDPQLRVIPLRSPTPIFPWWIMWRRNVPEEHIDALTGLAVDERTQQHRLVRACGDIWLPQADRDYLDPLTPAIKEGP